MKRSRHCQVPGFRTQAAVMLTAAMGLSAAHAASPVKVIFSAENALYGAGYDIGRADGWYDNKLRGAVRDYQDKTGLATSGDLDSQTLKALGVKATANAPISSNAVASRKDAVAALGLPELELRSGPRPVTKTEPQPKPEPEHPAQLYQTNQDSGAEEASVVARPTIKKSAKSVAKPPVDKEEYQPVITETSTYVEDEPLEIPATLTAVSEPVAETSPAPESETKVIDSSLPANTKPVTAAEVATVEADNSEAATAVAEQADSIDNTSIDNPPANEPRRSTGGGFFSVLFDFFFGWLV